MAQKKKTEIIDNSDNNEVASTTTKKPIYKKWWFWVIIVVVVLVLIIATAGNSDDDTDSLSQEKPVVTTEENKEKPTEKPVVTEAPIVLTDGEKGEFGEMFTFNKGTSDEESFMIYRVPAGTYVVTNTGSNMNQFNVYESETQKTDAGFEEFKKSNFVGLIDVNKSETIEIADGDLIKFIGGSFKLEKVN